MSDLRLSIISDVHVTDWGSGFADFKEALELHSHKLPETDGYVFVGDICYELDEGRATCLNLHTENYDMVVGAVREYCGDKPVIVAMGNHEYPQGNTEPSITLACMRLFTEKWGQPLREHKVINGYHIITIPCRGWLLPNCNGDELWMENEIDKALADDPAKPVFVVTHAVPHHSVPGTSGEEGRFTDEFLKFLKARPRVVMLTGHMHHLAQDERAIRCEGYTQINCPMCGVGYICISDCDFEQYHGIFGISQSLSITVDGTVVQVAKYDNHTGREIGKPWKFDVSKPYKYTALERVFDKVEDFAPDALPYITQTENGKMLAIPQTPDFGIPFYEITAVAENFKLHKLVPGDLYNYERMPLFTSPLPVPDGAVVTVTPAGFFGGRGKKVELKA